MAKKRGRGGSKGPEEVPETPEEAPPKKLKQIRRRLDPDGVALIRSKLFRSKKDPRTVAKETGRALSTVYLIKANTYLLGGAPLGRPKANPYQKAAAQARANKRAAQKVLEAAAARTEFVEIEEDDPAPLELELVEEDPLD